MAPSKMEGLYKGTASLGRFTASLRFYGSIVVAVVLVAVSIYLFTRPVVKTVKVSGKVEEANCNLADKTCNLKVKYTTQDGVERTSNVMMSSSVAYTTGQPVDFSYEVDNPTKLYQTVVSKRLVGFALIGIAVLIVVGSYVWKYVTSKYEVAAAATGAGDIFSTVSSVFR